jgi:predicted GNAT family acetyltransferase
MLNVSRFDDAAAFLAHAEEFLREDAIDNNVMLGIAGRLIDSPQDDAVMVTVDDGGTPCLAGLMTPPWRLIVSTGRDDAISVLVNATLEQGARPSGVVGLSTMAERFSAVWCDITGETSAPETGMNLYIAKQAVLPADVSGQLRVAGTDDTEWLADAYINFAIDIDASHAERDGSRDSAEAAIRRGDAHLWDVSGVPVSMACCTRMAPKGARVGPVYTPPGERGKGYASAAVAALTAQLLDDGAGWCAIFADAENATTNTMYQRIGYKEHGTYREYDFEP